MYHVEWSGVLFYDTKGSIEDAENFQIIIKNILLMDKGTGGHTSFSWDGDVVSYQMKNQKAIDWKKGLIHSHNTMNVFYSGEDWDEIYQNTPQHNFYLSMIVNVRMEVEAKVCFMGELYGFNCRNEKGKEYLINPDTNRVPQKVLFTYDCDIDMPDIKVKVPKEFEDRFEVISKQPPNDSKPKTGYKVNKDYEDLKKSWYDDESTRYYGKGDWRQDTNKWLPAPQQVAKRIEPTRVISMPEKFLCYALRLGVHIENDNLNEVLEDLEMADKMFNRSYILEAFSDNLYTFLSNFYTTKMLAADEVAVKYELCLKACKVVLGIPEIVSTFSDSLLDEITEAIDEVLEDVGEEVIPEQIGNHPPDKNYI